MSLRIHSVLLIALASASLFGPATAATAPDSHSGHAMPMAASGADAASLAEGVVKKVDKVKKKLTLAHGPLPGGMPAMTMAYRVKDAAWLDQIKPGQKIRFAAEEIKGVQTVVRFEPVK